MKSFAVCLISLSTVIGIATPASSIEETIIIRAIGRIDSLLAQGQSDQAFDEFRGFKASLLGYIERQSRAQLYNLQANLSLGDYPKAASKLQKSLAADPTQKSLFEILVIMARNNSELYDMLATALDEVGLSDAAHDSRVLAKDRRRFVEMLEAARSQRRVPVSAGDRRGGLDAQAYSVALTLRGRLARDLRQLACDRGLGSKAKK